MVVKGNARVLIADGQEVVRTAMFRALLSRDIFCDCVSNGGDAIARLGEREYALVILDFALPNAGAAAVLEALRTLSAAARPIVIAIATGNSDGARDSDGELVQMILRKPLRVSEAADMVEACISHKRTA